MIGKTLGHYEILAPLGEGGMGQVYRARDTTLDRDVAIKVLPEDFASDANRLARFERETKLLASLNHPNIATIFGFEESDGVRFIAMELVEGQSLAERIEASGRIEVDEALEIARRIALALEAAHEAGVIHRDLKPANVQVAIDGTVKVLDFGLAKAYEVDGSEPSSELSQSPTMMAATGTGVIMGTAPYMSPEQARGLAVDKRADIWAFGCVLYEMLTGKTVFGGKTVSDVIAAIIEREPDWSSLPNRLHPRLRELLERCLAKDPRSRWHDVADVRLDVEGVQRDPHGTEQRLPPFDRGKQRTSTVWALASFVLGAVATGAVMWSLPGAVDTDTRTVRFSYSLPLTETWTVRFGNLLAVSPDGSRIAYVADQQLYVRGLDQLEGTPLPGTDGASSPFFSPDGNWVGFATEGSLKRVSVAGGAPLDISAAWGVTGATWGRNDTVVFGGGVGSGLLQVPVSGGIPQPVTFPDPEKGEVHHGLPQMLPDGKTVVFTVATGEGSRLALLSLETGSWRELLPAGSGAQYLSAGYLLFSDEGNLRLVPFDLDDGEVTDSIVPVLDGIEWESVAGLELASFAVSPAGNLAYIPGDLRFPLTTPVWVDRNGRETSIEVDPALYLGAYISPDGRRVAFTRIAADGNGIGDAWVLELGTNRMIPVVREGAVYNAIWTPDSAMLTFTLNGDLFETFVDREGAPTNLLRREKYQFSRSWSPNGQSLAFVDLSATGLSVWILSREGDLSPLINSNSTSPRFSPQGGWLAYLSDESGQSEVYVRRHPGSDRGQRVSSGGGLQPVWSVDGKELFYRSGDRMMAVPITTEPDLSVGVGRELWERPYFDTGMLGGSYDVAADGRFLMLSVSDSSYSLGTQVNVVTNWFDELKRRVPTDP